jgi:predicted  nucleic acid-binding Zn-ribbon protein
MTRDDYKRILDFLRQLQDYQLEATRLEADIEATPGRIADLEAETEAGAAAVEKAQEEQREEEKRHRQLEGELGALQDKLSHYEDQILKVKTNEQLWALQKEVEFSKNKISEAETGIIESLERLDDVAGRLAEAKKERERLMSENKAGISELQNNLIKMQERLVEVTEGKDRLRSEIPAEYLAIFDRLQGARGGLAVASALDGTCQACHFRIRPQVFLDMRYSKGIFQCDNCKRILYYEEEPPLENPAQLA